MQIMKITRGHVNDQITELNSENWKTWAVYDNKLSVIDQDKFPS